VYWIELAKSSSLPKKAVEDGDEQAPKNNTTNTSKTNLYIQTPEVIFYIALYSYSDIIALMKSIVVAFSGPSNSGKTTLIVKISNILQDRGYKVAIIKHDPKDKASFDKEGKDSYKFSQTGANVAVISPSRTTIFKQESSSFEDATKALGEFDYLLVEGLKTLELPRITIFRDRVDPEYFEYSDAFAVDNTITQSLPKTTLNLNDPEQIIQWINTQLNPLKNYYAQ
jgi:molybdopterin-guanine dinucleotide biosynthesis protein B